MTLDNLLNEDPSAAAKYRVFHADRIQRTIATLHKMGSRRIVEIGGHPWVMTSTLLDEPGLSVEATISAEEITQWPDDIGVMTRQFRLRTTKGRECLVTNYSANVERMLFDLREKPDTIIACEIIEHLVRAPHVMFLNVNRWLPPGGRLLLTTPNGCQFANPFRRHSPTPAYRANVYERHSYLYTLDGLVDLVGLCGFTVTEAGFWDAYQRRGMSRIYGTFAQLPGRYFQEKFCKTLYVVAQKESDVTQLARVPRVYDTRGDWEFIAPHASGTPD